MKKAKRETSWHRLLKENSRAVVTTYVVLRALVFVALVASLISKDIQNCIMCVFVLILYTLPDILERKLKIKLPSALEIILLCFIYSALILGEIQNYYAQFPHWDLMLHTLSGFLTAAFGYSLVELLNDRDDVPFSLSPIFMAVVSFCVSMTIGIMWEFFEFAADNIMGWDMQKDTVITAFRSVTLDPAVSNTPILVDNITEVYINGKELGVAGYLDIGLLDTMEDLLVNFIGALVFSIIGFFHTKHKGKSKIVSGLVPRKAEKEE